jgi:hypothetical protein
MSGQDLASLAQGVAELRPWFADFRDGAPPEVVAVLERVDAALAELGDAVGKRLAEETQAAARTAEVMMTELVARVSSGRHRPQRKHGRLVAHMLGVFAVDPDAALTVADVAMAAYGVPLHQVTKAHRVAVLRAMRRLNQLDRRWQLRNGEGTQGQVIIYDCTRVLSHGLAVEKADWSNEYQYRRPSDGWRPRDEAELRARLAPGGRCH